MRPRIVEVRPLPGCRLWLRFADGTCGEADVSDMLGHGAFSAWHDPDFFARVALDEGGRTVCWPDGLDLDPYVLYSQVAGTPLPGSHESFRAAS